VSLTTSTRPDLHRAPEHRHEVDRVEHRDHHSLLYLDAERCESVARAVHALREVRIRVLAEVILHRDARGTPLREVPVDEVDRRIVRAGQAYDGRRSRRIDVRVG
jgi:hypothetical protein